jgi:hypothetical protein
MVGRPSVKPSERGQADRVAATPYAVLVVCPIAFDGDQTNVEQAEKNVQGCERRDSVQGSERSLGSGMASVD